MKGKERFIYQLNLLEPLLKAASGEKNPGEWLYRNSARTSTFMLEALCKIYHHVNDEETFQGLKKHFNQLEDAIGQLDYFETFYEIFEKDPAIDNRITQWVRDKVILVTEDLNNLLVEDKWTASSNKRIEKIKEQLDDVKWPSDETECVATEKYYHSSITEIFNFYGTIIRFTDIETQVHSLRRKLRWLSIYPHAMMGMIQLKESAVPPEQQQYQTTEILNSPFIKLPAPGDSCMLLLNKPQFISLSWMIDAMGKLKDKGLKAALINSAVQDLGLPQPVNDLSGILGECTHVAAEFFQKNVLEDLLAGISS